MPRKNVLYTYYRQGKRVDVTPTWEYQRQFHPRICQKKSFRVTKPNFDTMLTFCRKKHSQKLSLQSKAKRRK